MTGKREHLGDQMSNQTTCLYFSYQQQSIIFGTCIYVYVQDALLHSDWLQISLKFLSIVTKIQADEILYHPPAQPHPNPYYKEMQ